MHKYTIAYILFFLLMFSCKQETNIDTSTLVVDKSLVGSNKKIDSHAKFRADQRKAKHLNAGGMLWMSMDEAIKFENSGNKKYIIDIYTEWCGWCKQMDKKTFSDPEVQKYLQENFNLVKFNAEQKESIEFKGQKYDWKDGGRRGINMLAVDLLGNRMSYPTIVYLDENMQKIKSSPGYKNPSQLIQELKVINRS